ncbi:MAG: hypothetical protein NVS4B1_14550 [Ktedonobacteraceae bacterium]
MATYHMCSKLAHLWGVIHQSLRRFSTTHMAFPSTRGSNLARIMDSTWTTHCLAIYRSSVTVISAIGVVDSMDGCFDKGAKVRTVPIKAMCCTGKKGDGATSTEYASACSAISI